MPTTRAYRLSLVSHASVLSLLFASASLAQTVPDTPKSETTGQVEGAQGGETGGPTTSGTTQGAGTAEGFEEIIVTAQRRAQALQDVPIAVSAFSAEALERQQIENTSDLQLSLPNITFTKSNFTAANFTIRGIGDAAVAASGDTSVGVHVNDMPLTSTRLFETEFFDLERIEVLRGPQGTLFGRNATSGVINLITARPNLESFQAKAEGEYGNYNSIKANAMINLPIGDMLGVRLAGIYLKRDGFTKNLFDNSRIDGRDLWAVRGTLRFEPTASTRLDIIGYHFREDDDRSRIQKQLCHRDPTGVLGCLPDRLAFEPINGNATLGGVITSSEFLNIASGGALGVFGLGSVYGPDIYAGLVNPPDYRTVNIDYPPTYKAEETHAQARLEQELGEAFNLTMIGGYAENSVSSRTDYNLTAANPFGARPGLLAFRAVPLFDAAEARLFQGDNLCVSAADRSYVGFIGGRIDRCAPYDVNFDKSDIKNRQYSIEAHLDSDFDGPLNFLIGGIYLDNKVTGSNYFVNSTSLDYGAAVLGAASGGAAALGPPMYNNETNLYRLKSYGIFGEAYWDITDQLKLTLGARYSNDRKFVRDRVVIYNFPIPYGAQGAFSTPGAAEFDADPSQPGNQPFREARVKFDKITGRAVLDYKITPDNLLYASFSRGYKSGGINPPFNPALFTAPVTYKPEIINAYEIGSKNTFGGGTFQANLTGFYYDYKALQISRILNRTSFNDNTDATVWGIEGEFLIAPDPAWLFNINTSYLKTKIKDLQLPDTRDPSGGRSDVVIIKDITNAANCAVIPAAAGVPRGDAVVNAFNAAVGLQPTTPVPGTTTTGAFSICEALAQTIAGANLPYQVNRSPTGEVIGLPDGAPFDLSGNQLPNSPKYKVSVGGQYTYDFGNGMNLVARADLAYTGEFYGRSFNRQIDRIQGYEIVNAQLQLNGPDQRWFVRGFVQNLTNNQAVTGMYVTDPSSGLFTNIFTLEPRRYGVAAGVRF